MRCAGPVATVALLFVGSTLPSAAAPPPPSHARSKLVAANAAAKAWKPDAVLIQVAARDVADDGRQVFWDYGFWSVAAQTCLVVNAAGAETQSVESGGAACESGAVGEFMDSDRAIQIARSNGITKPNATMVVNHDGKRTIWSVMDGAGMESGDVILDLDAVTGAIVNKAKQQ